MAVSVVHAKVSAVADEGDTTEVQPSDWNAEHTVSGLGTAAEKATGTSGNVVPLLDGANTWSATQTLANVVLDSANTLAWSTDLFLQRDAANTLAQRNGTAAQALRVYNTRTDASNYELATFNWTTVANRLTIGPAAAGSGTVRSIGLTSHLLFNTDNTYDIGALGATRPRNIYAGGIITATQGIAGISTSNTIAWVNGSYLFGAATSGALTGTMRLVAGGGTSVLNFGGDTSSFPALKRSTTVLQARLADDSGFAPLQGNLRTQANAVAETPTATHTMIVTDAGGTAYRVLCVV